MEIPQGGHESVLLGEVTSALSPKSGQVVVDCTLGRGGHGAALGKMVGESGVLIGLDADPRNLEFAQKRLAEAPCRKRLFHASFAELGDVLAEAGVEQVDGILADLGVSTNQLFEAEYGMSFSSDMPLDMRLDPRGEVTAADMVNRMREEELADLLFNLAQERYSRRIARKIGEERRISPIISTGRLADIVRSAIPKRGGAPERIDPPAKGLRALTPVAPSGSPAPG